MCLFGYSAKRKIWSIVIFNKIKLSISSFRLKRKFPWKLGTSVYRQTSEANRRALPFHGCLTLFLCHGGTTEEGNSSYLLPRAAAAGSNGTNKWQTRLVPVDEIAWFFVYGMDVTRFKSGANAGIQLYLTREIWQFKVFTGKEVTMLQEEGNWSQFRMGKKVSLLHQKWFYDIWHETECTVWSQ